MISDEVAKKEPEGVVFAHASTLNSWEQVAVLLHALFAADVTLALRLTRLCMHRDCVCRYV